MSDSLPAGDFDSDALRDALAAHVERTIGPIVGVEREILSDGPPLHLLIVGPSADFPAWTYVTCGASAYRMPASPGDESAPLPRRAEYMIHLPFDWARQDANGLPETHPGHLQYPLIALKRAARAARALGAHFGFGHTVTHGEFPATLHPSTVIAGFLLGFSPNRADALEWITPSGEAAVLLTLIGLTAREIQFAHTHELDDVFARLGAAGAEDVFIPDRKDAV